MAGEEFTGIELKIVLPKNIKQDVKQKVQQLQNMVSKHKLDIGLNISPEAIRGLERLSQMSANVARQMNNVKSPRFDLANPSKEAQLYLDRITALTTGLKRFNGSVVETHDALGRVNLKVQTADGILKKYALQWDSARNSLKQINRQDTDKSDIIREQQLLETQKIRIKLDKDFQKQLEQNIASVNKYYDTQQNQIQKNIQLKQKEIQSLKEEAQLRIASKQSLEQYLKVFNTQFDTKTTMFSKNYENLFNPDDLDNFRKQKDQITKLASSGAISFDQTRQKVKLLNAEFGKFNADSFVKGMNNAHSHSESFTKSITTAAYKMAK